MPRSHRDSRALSLLRELHRAYRRVQAADVAFLKRYGLRQGDFDVIATLGNTEGLRMSDLAARMLTSAPNVTRMVKRLEAEGFVTRVRGELSDREVVARLTERGEAVFAEVYPEAFRFHDALYNATLSGEEQDRLIELLARVAPD